MKRPLASFYSNENFPLPAVERLRELGHDVLTSFEAGEAGQRIDDERVLSFATSEARAVLTHNHQHFKKLHRSTSAQHAGIVSCTEDLNFVALADRVHARVAEFESLSGLFIRIIRG